MADQAAGSFTWTSRPAEGDSRGGSSVSHPEAEKRANVSSGPTEASSFTLPTLPAEANSANNANSAAGTAAAPQKLRSCVVCRSRKVRCNKESPCSNCRRAGIPCVIPSADRPPRWARRLERVAQNAAAEERLAQAAQAAQAAQPPTAQVMERVRNLESLVKELSSQLEQAHAATNSSAATSPASSAQDRDGDHPRATNPAAGASNIQSRFGRLVLSDAQRGRYVSSGFWSRVNDELDEIRVETQYLAEADAGSSEDEKLSGASPSTRELERTASERHAFLFQHNLSPLGPDLQELRPLPSQIPFLLDVFYENVNLVVQIVHMPTVNNIARRSRGSDITQLTPANEALMFSIYYAAITSMEDDDVVNNFGSTKTDLNLKYRLGLEHALARADFLHIPDITLVQAFTIFLLLVRRYDSPRFCWMMTGLVIRMAQALGLQRDGTHFKQFTPFEIDLRRRVWYALCALDVRASEDQGTEFTIQYGSFDTKLPWNINDDDIDANTKEIPIEREGVTHMTFAILSMEISNISRQMLSPDVGLEEQNRLLNTINTNLEERYLRFSSESGTIRHWVMVVTTLLVVGKLTLFTHLPVLFSSPSEHFSDEVRHKLLVAAIEVAELNHALNAEKACCRWRWVFQTYTHWHAIVYLLIDICRRPWSPVVDRAWIALHSPWLIPAKSKLDKDMRTWVPLRKLMLKARMHRDTEIRRLRDDAPAARQLEIDDRKLPVPSTAGSVSASAAADIFRENWRRLVGIPATPEEHVQTRGQTSSASLLQTGSAQAFPDPTSTGLNNTTNTSVGFQPTYPSTNPASTHESHYEAPFPSTALNAIPFDEPFSNAPGFNTFSETTVDWSNSHPNSGGLLSWFWADTDSTGDVAADAGMGMMDFSLDLDVEMDWHDWVESAKGMEMDAHASTSKPDNFYPPA
ncbi:hypothetical protein F5B18DRAFT_357304 [Nemania serpens]|nr:hypothetical protein F5B18DRAFT_357304 [Nemania serpens]